MIRRLILFSNLGRALILTFIAFGGWANATSRDLALPQNQWSRYFHDTYHGLDCMRKSSGLVGDSAVVDSDLGQTCPLVPIYDPTSPTNIALDLLVQLEAREMADLKRGAELNIARIFSTLGTLKFHAKSGLFFGQYDPATLEVRDNYVSAVDNLHLAYAIWVTAHSYSDAAISAQANTLFERMDFSVFYDSRDGHGDGHGDGLMRGGLWYNGTDWTAEEWKYSYFGSEGRSLYSLGWALQLVRDPQFLDKAFHSFTSDTFLWSDQGVNRPLLGLWDGGAFQLLLPTLLINERADSKLGPMFVNYAHYVQAEGVRLGLDVPAAFSACRFLDYYNGKAGSPGLVSRSNHDIDVPALRDAWDEVFTPHAAFLAAPGDRENFAKVFSRIEAIHSGHDSLYRTGIGWMDGYYVKGPNKGKVVPVVLALDQAMIALSIAEILSPDGMTIGARTIEGNAEVRARLRQYYDHTDSLRGL